MNVAADRLIDAMPDLVVAIGRDGRILSHGGGRTLPELALTAKSIGESVEAVWPAAVARAVRQLIRKSIAARGSVEATVSDNQQSYRLRITPEGPERTLCVIRPLTAGDAHAEPASLTGTLSRPYLDRRGFLRRFEQVVAQGALTELPVTVVVFHLVGVEEISRIDPKLAEQVVTQALVRLAVQIPATCMAMNVCVGQLSDCQLAFVVRTADRATIDAFVSDVCAGLFLPVEVDHTSFTLRGYAGVAILGRDSGSPNGLLDNARIAANEARHADAKRARFFSDTMKLKSLARLDIARELRDAIDARALDMRYLARRELADERLDALVAYVCWTHPLRGEILPREFLSVAETTGSALLLSRTVLKTLARDFHRLCHPQEPAVRLSFGPLRSHVLHESFITDLQECLQATGMPLSSLEIRIAESTFIALPMPVCRDLNTLGVRIVIDEVGRGFGSLNRIVRSPVWGMQLDRAWVADICHDELARKVCSASIASATALGLIPIATGIDDTDQRRALVGLGCRYGSGDLYGRVDPSRASILRPVTTRRSSDRLDGDAQ